MDKKEPHTPKLVEPSVLFCDFCGKTQHEVAKLIAGPKTFICDECVELCRDIAVEDGYSQPTPEIVRVVRWLRRMADAVSNTGHPKRDNNYGRAAESLRLCLPTNHPMHPNQDQDDVPELGDPRA